MYYYLDDEKSPQGPFSADELKAKLAAREIYEHSLIAQKGAAQWNSLISVFPVFAQQRKDKIQRKKIESRFEEQGSTTKPSEMSNEQLYDKGDYDFSMDLWATVKYCLKRLFNCSGRATRQEFWYYHLFLFLVLLFPVIVFFFIAVLFFPDSDAASTVLAVYMIVLPMLTPFLIVSVSVRRLHDLGLKGDWMGLCLFPPVNFLLLIYLVKDSQAGVNEYGLSLKYPDGPNHQS